MKATGPSIAIMRFDTAQTGALRKEQVDDLAYHIARLLTGQATAESEWTYAGVEIEVEPNMEQGPE